MAVGRIRLSADDPLDVRPDRAVLRRHGEDCTTTALDGDADFHFALFDFRHLTFDFRLLGEDGACRGRSRRFASIAAATCHHHNCDCHHRGNGFCLIPEHGTILPYTEMS